ncbi:MAG: translation elongation factor EF-1 subunit alpha [Candidatus Hodarchaeaceae archaeon]|nr:translation elongation factor EF-1 subunit alpha [Candidatus Hodarchaeaceae archaeon]
MAKPHINLVFIGHVDHGKSTLIGRLLFETGLISEKELREEAGSFKFAWVMDRLREERERGLTIDLSYGKFETSKNEITIIDAPGHRDFVKNMITGASQADAAVLVVAADDGIMPQTREHAALAFTLGVDQLIIAINKMDLVNFERAAYEKIKQDLVALLSGIGYRDAGGFLYLPIAAFHGENITKPSSRMPWYDGPTIIQALDVLKEPEKPIDKPLRIPVQDVFSISGVGTVPIGRVETGVLKVGDVVVFEPSGVRGEVRSIEMHHQPLWRAEPGDNIGFNVRGIAKGDVKRGDVAGHPEAPPTVAREFTAKIIALAVPTAIAPGFAPLFHCHAAHIPGRIEEILQKIDPRTGAVVEERPDSLRRGEAGVIRIVPSKPMVIERVGEIPSLARFAMRHGGQTVAAGMCIDLVPAK